MLLNMSYIDGVSTGYTLVKMFLCLACRLLRWGASTAADAARLEQDWLQHHQDMQAEMSATASESELAQKASQAATANQDTYEQLQYQQQQQRQVRDSALRHWTSIKPDTLPGASAEDLVRAQTQASQMRHASAKHIAVQRSGSGNPMLLEDVGEAAAAAEQTDLHLSSELL